jgi:hypothetical protein
MIITELLNLDYAGDNSLTLVTVERRLRASAAQCRLCKTSLGQPNTPRTPTATADNASRCAKVQQRDTSGQDDGADLDELVARIQRLF